jgi:thioredoxin 1
MKNIVIIILLVFGLTMCTSDKNNKDAEEQTSDYQIDEPSSNVKADKKSTTSGKATVKLTKPVFIDKVMDYESNPDSWNYRGELPCIIDFYADWCAPCKQVAPALEELAKEYKGKIIIYKVDTEQERELASAFGIRSIPTFLFCPMEGQPQMSSGIARTPEETKKMFEQIIQDFLLKG